MRVARTVVFGHGNSLDLDTIPARDGYFKVVIPLFKPHRVHARGSAVYSYKVFVDSRPLGSVLFLIRSGDLLDAVRRPLGEKAFVVSARPIYFRGNLRGILGSLYVLARVRVGIGVDAGVGVRASARGISAHARVGRVRRDIFNYVVSASRLAPVVGVVELPDVLEGMDVRYVRLLLAADRAHPVRERVRRHARHYAVTAIRLVPVVFIARAPLLRESMYMLLGVRRGERAAANYSHCGNERSNNRRELPRQPLFRNLHFFSLSLFSLIKYIP